MSVARLHHYVPRCYLKRFTRGKDKKSQLFAVDMVERRTFWTSPRNVCAVKDFNRVDIPGQPIDVLEKALAKFDGELGSALQTIERNQSLEDAHAKLVLLNFASVVAARNPEMRANMEDAHRRTYELMGDMIVATRQSYETTIARMVERGDLAEEPNVSYEQVRDFVRGGQYDLVFPAGYHVTAEMEAQDTVLRTMLDRRWALLRAPNGCEFITSDMPVCLLPDRPTRHPVGFGLKSTTVLLPVSSSLLAMGSFDGIERSFDVSREHVATLNLAVAIVCDRLVFAKSEKFETADADGHVTIGPDLIYRIIASPRRPRGKVSEA